MDDWLFANDHNVAGAAVHHNHHSLSVRNIDKYESF
jgi:hypothetical protein